MIKTILISTLLASSYTTAIASTDTKKEELSLKRIANIEALIKSPKSPEVTKKIEVFQVCKDYGIRRHITNEILYEITNSSHIKPDSRKPKGFAIPPIDARQLAVLEYTWGEKFHNKHWEHDEPQNPRPGAAAILKKGYNTFSYAIYTQLLLNDDTFKKELLNIELSFNKETKKWDMDVSKTINNLVANSQNFELHAPSIINMQDIESIAKSQNILLDELKNSFNQYAENITSQYVYNWSKNFTNNPTLISIEDDTIKGSSNNDYLLGSLGNDKIFGNSGDDILIGDSEWNIECEQAITTNLTTPLLINYNDYLEGGRGNDEYRFYKDWGKDIINNCSASKKDIDIINFKYFISPDSINVIRQENDLILKEIGTDNQITIQNHFSDNCPKIHQVIFSLTNPDRQIIWSQTQLENKYSHIRYYLHKLSLYCKQLWNEIGDYTSDIFYDLITKLEKKPEPVEMKLPKHLQNNKKTGAD